MTMRDVMREVPAISIQALEEEEDDAIMEGGPPSSVSTYHHDEEDDEDDDLDEDLLMSSSPRPSPSSIMDLYDWHEEEEENLL